MKDSVKILLEYTPLSPDSDRYDDINDSHQALMLNVDSKQLYYVESETILNGQGNHYIGHDLIDLHDVIGMLKIVYEAGLRNVPIQYKMVNTLTGCEDEIL